MTTLVTKLWRPTQRGEGGRGRGDVLEKEIVGSCSRLRR
jgi:hypothetical protein